MYKIAGIVVVGSIIMVVVFLALFYKLIQYFAKKRLQKYYGPKLKKLDEDFAESIADND